LESGAPFMVMEYLQGQDLSALLASLGPPPLASAVEYAIQTCEGLEEAHRAGFVHRDVKPSNLFLTRRPNGTPCIKIVDFGISKAVTSHGAAPLHSTSTRAIFGSPLYMAPEQMRAARDVDARADLWSLGASLYELLCGTVPFAAESLVDLAYRIANEDPPSLRSKGAEIPRRLEQIVLRCLEKDRNRRFPDARSLALALEEFRTPQAWESTSDLAEDDKTTVMDPLPPEPARSEAAGELSGSLSSSSVSWGRSQRLGRRRARPRRPLLYVAALAVGGTIATLAALFTRQEDAPPASAPTVMSPTTMAHAPSAAASEAPAPSTEPPTVSVTDLPVAFTTPALPSVPVLTPAAPVATKPAEVSHASCARSANDGQTGGARSGALGRCGMFAPLFV
jgi:serine/threonine protein kinase